MVSASSVLTPQMGEATFGSGADFLVRPGTTDTPHLFAAECRVPFLPGVATVTEMMHVQTFGGTTVKLFPAELLGDVAFVQAVSGPLPFLKFCSTGGVDA